MSNTPNLRVHRKRLLYISSLRNRGGGNAVNECKTPDRGATKADLAEFQKERLRLRRARQLRREPSSSWRPRRKNDDAAYRKSIWPASKIEKRRG
jgi:hypothetical protein